MPIATAAAEKVRAAMMSLFTAQLNAFLAAQGADDLADTAFVPVVVGDPPDDAVCVAWSGTTREGETWGLRDGEVHLTINVWAYGDNDVDAQQRAAAIEAALVACLDNDEIACLQAKRDSYLGGTCAQPPQVGATRCVTSEITNRMLWHLAIPVACPVRTTRPEFTPVVPEA